MVVLLELAMVFPLGPLMVNEGAVTSLITVRFTVVELLAVSVAVAVKVCVSSLSPVTSTVVLNVPDVQVGVATLTVSILMFTV